MTNASQQQLNLFVWADNRPSAQVIDIIPIVALRMWQRRQWPKPLDACEHPIALLPKRGAA
jgi:hypothetical protein